MSAKECLRKARYKLGMTQKEFADLLGINKSSLSLYETGDRQPGFPRIRKIVEKLKQHNIHLEYKDLRDDE